MVKTRKAHLVLAQDNRSWIIEKMAARIAEYSPEFGFEVSTGEAERADADINHWMSYAFANVPHNTPATMLITHLDDPYKVSLVKSELTSGVDVGIALSSHTCDMLVAAGVKRDAMAFAVPGHDFAASPRRVVIGLTTRLYADGRKREFMLVELAQKMKLDRFRFEIFGLGWEDVIPKLEAAGAEVAYWPGSDDFRSDYVEMMAHVPMFDYYLYLGRDEGSLGPLDALPAAVLGGTSFKGGIGTIWGTVIGALIIQSLNTGLVLLGMNDFVQMVVKGAIIIVAVILDERKNR